MYLPSLELYKVDICSSINFPTHADWWQSYKFKLKEEGKTKDLFFDE